MEAQDSPLVGLTYDLRAEYLAEGYTEDQVAEFDSDGTIDALASAIEAGRRRVDRIGGARALCRRLVAGDRWDMVFNIAEGLAGRCRESQVPSLLELYDVPYTFSDPLVCAATLDKAYAKKLVRAAGLNTPRFRVVHSLDDTAPKDLNYPLFAKPLAEGTGRGIGPRSRIDTPDQIWDIIEELLTQCRQPVLLEEYLPGREFTVGLLGTGKEARVLGTMEIEILPGEAMGVYSYESKEKCEQQVRYSALREGKLRVLVERLALKAYVALECRDAARVDIRIDAAGAPSFMEVNPLPGLHPSHSDLPMIATQEGMPYEELIDSILRSAWRRQEAHDAL